MSLSGDISTASSSLSDIKDAIITKGGSIIGNITTYATSINNLPEDPVVKRVVSPGGVYQFPTTYSLPENAIDVGDYALSSTFYGCTFFTSVDLSSLITISGESALSDAFNGCTSLTSVDLSLLTAISGDYALSSTFYGCTSLTSVSFPSLTTISGESALDSAFESCTSLTSLSFPSLTSTSFGSYTNQFNNMLSGVTGCTVHFPSNLQSVIGDWSDVVSGFNGSDTIILFDLPATT